MPRALAALLLLSCAAVLKGADSVSVIMEVTILPDTPFSLATLSSSGQVSSRDFMALPITVDGDAQAIDEITLLYRSTAAPAGFAPAMGAPAMAPMAAPPLGAGDVGTFSTAGIALYPALPANVTYYRGSVIVPGAVYTALGAVDYYLRVRLADNSIHYLGLSGGSTQELNLTPFSSVYTPVYESVVTAAGGPVVMDGDAAGQNAGITFPAGAVRAATRVWIEQLDPLDASRVPTLGGMAPVAAYQFESEVNHFNTAVNVHLRYADVDGAPGTVDGTALDERALRVFWWDGFDWRLMGGSVQSDNNLASTRTGHFSIYALFPAAGAPAAEAYRPLEKIITPNGDNKNDFANFAGLSGDFEIKIFDATGRLVRSIRTPDAPEWNGAKDGGEIVENGVYIYQFRDGSSNGWVSGTIGVAK